MPLSVHLDSQKISLMLTEILPSVQSRELSYLLSLSLTTLYTRLA